IGGGKGYAFEAASQGLGKALGGPSGGRGQAHARGFRSGPGRQAQDVRRQRRLAGAGSAGYDQQPFFQGGFQSRLLAGVEGHGRRKPGAAGSGQPQGKLVQYRIQEVINAASGAGIRASSGIRSGFRRGVRDGGRGQAVRGAQEFREPQAGGSFGGEIFLEIEPAARAEQGHEPGRLAHDLG